MSVIFGIVAPAESTVNDHDFQRMADSYTSKYPYDRLDTHANERLAIGCMQQWLTDEARFEQNPYIDSEAQLVLVADVLLDHRAQLAAELGLSLHSSTPLDDVRLLAAAYKKWGEDCVEHLYGHFAFALYDGKRDLTFCARDPIGNGPLSYAIKDGCLLFATSPRALRVILQPQADESMLLNYLACRMGPKGTDSLRTYFQGIDYLAPARTLTWQNGQLSFRHYWQPKRGEQWLRARDEDIADEFIRLFEEATREALRTSGSHGILLSGGLDSTSVAAMAAPLLATQGRSLQAYTHVPLADYVHNNKQLVNERPYVEAILQMYTNIQPTWLEIPDLNGFNMIDNCIDLIEQPYIFFANSNWLITAYEMAGKNGNRVMLIGKHGNGSISFSPYSTVYNYYYKQRQWGKLLRELPYLRRAQRLGIWQTFKYMKLQAIPTDTLTPYFTQRDNLIRTLMNEPTAQSLHWNMPKLDFDTPFEMIAHLSSNDKTQLRGEIHTAFGLPHRVITRDPTADVRLLDFLFSLPYEQFVGYGVQKRLLRRTMADKLPPLVLDVKRRKGMQSADYMYRLRDSHEVIFEAFRTACQQPLIRSWLSKETIEIPFARFSEWMHDREMGGQMMRLIAIDKFLRMK